MFSEQSVGEPEENFAEKASVFSSEFNNWLAENPKLAEELKKELLEAAGIEESELKDREMGYDMSLMKIPVGELSKFGTLCGARDNKSFTAMTDFLQSKGLEFVIALGDNDQPMISSIAINISEEDIERIEAMVKSEEGSLRGESSQNGNWSIFESE